MNTVKISSNVVMGATLFFSNLIPIIGPCLASSAMGYSEKRFKKLYEIPRKSIILAITIGHSLFFFIVGITINFCAIFLNQKIFWIIILSGLLVNIALSIIFYFIGAMRYQKRI